MLYESTRGSLHKKTGAQAVIQGIAEDKGLYVPAQIPALPFALKDMADQMKKGTVGYREVAQAVIGTFFDDFTEEEMGACIAGAYDKKFTARDIVEMKEAGGAHFLELYHGKTAAFKDMALSILPYFDDDRVQKGGRNLQNLHSDGDLRRYRQGCAGGICGCAGHRDRRILSLRWRQPGAGAPNDHAGG